MGSRQLIETAGSGPVMGELFRIRSLFCCDRVAIQDERRSLSYAQLNQRVNQLANALAGGGVRPGD